MGLFDKYKYGPMTRKEINAYNKDLDETMARYAPTAADSARCEAEDKRAAEWKAKCKERRG